jgi:hypothetical protein
MVSDHLCTTGGGGGGDDGVCHHFLILFDFLNYFLLFLQHVP